MSNTKKILLVIIAIIVCGVLLKLIFDLSNKYSIDKLATNIVPSGEQITDALPNGGTVTSTESEVPPLPSDFVEIGKEHDLVTGPTEIGNKLAYLAVNDRNNFFKNTFIVYDGKEIGKQYGFIVDIYNVGGKLAYTVSDEISPDAKTYLVYDGKEIGKGENYDKLKYPIEINGKLAYWVKKDGKSFIIYNGQEIGKGYVDVLPPQQINGQLVSLGVSKDTRTFLIPQGKELGGSYLIDTGFVLINGIPAYLTFENGKYYIVYNGQEIGKEYDGLWPPVEVNGKMAFMASKGKKNVIVYDGQELGSEYDTIWGPHNVNHKLAYMAEKNGKYFIVYNGKEIGKEYQSIMESSIAGVNGKLVYVTKSVDISTNNVKTFIVMEK